MRTRGIGRGLGGCRVTPAGYFHMTRRLQALAGGRVVLALEGGYNLRSIAQSAEACAWALLGAEPSSDLRLDVSATPMGTLRATDRLATDESIALHAEFWQCLRGARPCTV
eukprot:7229861-Prymnesium_polylepis.2